MVLKKIGKQTLQFNDAPGFLSWASIVGPMEGKGPFGEYFDVVLKNNLMEGDTSWEKSEQKIMQHSMELALEKAGMKAGSLDFYLAGDLLNQIINANFSARFFGVPFLGLYGACSTLAEGLALAAMLIDGGYGDMVGVSASSHHDTAERQLRYPTELGAQRLMTSQWTVTGGGSYVLKRKQEGIRLTQATIGKIVDMGVKNAGDMGNAMAPAAFDTIDTHLQDLGRQLKDYDLVITGDLGTVGLNALKVLLSEKGHDPSNVTDCGILIYAPDQDVHAGASGCGCSAAMLNYFLQEMKQNKYRRIFLVGTGALLSPTSSWQGESIPSIAHGVVLEL